MARTWGPARLCSSEEVGATGGWGRLAPFYTAMMKPRQLGALVARTVQETGVRLQILAVEVGGGPFIWRLERFRCLARYRQTASLAARIIAATVSAGIGQQAAVAELVVRFMFAPQRWLHFLERFLLMAGPRKKAARVVVALPIVAARGVGGAWLSTVSTWRQTRVTLTA